MAGKGQPGMAEASAGARPKQRGGRIVPSRYMQYEKKGAAKAASNTSQCLALGVERARAASPKRSQRHRSFAAPQQATLGALQSTLLEGHGNARLDLEFSAINDKRNWKTPGTSRKEQTTLPSDPDDLIRMLESQTLLLTYASVKMEKNMAVLEEKAERNLLRLLEETGKLQRNAHAKKSNLLRLKKEHELSEALESQLEALSPVYERCVEFQEEYKPFATALDSTRHELPLKEVYMGEDRGHYLAGLQEGLAALQSVLDETPLEHSQENAKATQVVKELEEASLKLDAELPRAFGHVADLSASVSKEVSLSYQKACEDSLGLETMKQRYFS